MVLGVVAATYSGPDVLVQGHQTIGIGRVGGVQTRGKGMARALRCCGAQRHVTRRDAGIRVGLGQLFCRRSESA